MNKNTCWMVLIFSILLMSACGRSAQARSAADAALENEGAGSTADTAQSIDIPEELVFFEHFENGADRWEVGDGWVIQTNADASVLEGSVKGIAFVKGGGTWENYLLRSRMKIDEGVAALSAYLSPEGRYIVVCNQDGLYLAKETFSDGTITPLAMSDAPILGEWHWFALGVQDGRLQVGVDGELRLDAIDPDPLPNGTLGVGVGDQSRTAVDTIIVTDIVGEMRDEPTLEQITDFNLPQDVTMEAMLAALPEMIAENEGVELSADEAIPEDVDLEVVLMEGVREEEPLTAVEAPEVILATAEGQADEPVEMCDLYVQSVSIPKPWTAGEPLNVAVTVTNKGDAISPLFNVEWFPASDGIVGGSWEVLPLAPGVTLTLDWTYPGYPQPGEYTWLAQIDREGEVEEITRGNNTRSGTMMIEAAQ